jgi:hypothetical protein
MALTVMALTVVALTIMIGGEIGIDPTGSDPSSQHSARHATVGAFGPDRKPEKPTPSILSLVKEQTPQPWYAHRK